MPESTIIHSLDDFYERFGYIDPVDTLAFLDRLEATPPVSFITSDGAERQPVKDSDA